MADYRTEQVGRDTFYYENGAVEVISSMEGFIKTSTVFREHEHTKMLDYVAQEEEAGNYVDRYHTEWILDWWDPKITPTVSRFKTQKAFVEDLNARIQAIS